MKIINQYIILISAALMMLLSSCFTEEIQLDLNNQENKKVVITGWLNDLDDDQSIQISYSQDYFDDTGAEPIVNAIVTLSYNSESIDLTHSENGTYILPSEWKGLAETEYTLTVMHDEQEYQAVSLLRSMAEIDDIESRFFEENDSTSYYEIFFGFQESPGEGDGYFAIDYLKNTQQVDIIGDGGWTDDSFGDGEYYANITVTQNEHQLGDTVILEVHNAGKKATEYFQRISTEIFRDGLLDPPPVNVSTNLSNGAKGFFITSGKREHEIIIE